MKLNLINLAQEVSERFVEIETSFGPLKIYHVPTPFVWTFKPDWEPPPEPVIMMPIGKTGNRKQQRPAKPGEPEYDDWAKAAKAHDEETSDIQDAARYVLALRDQIEYPDDLSEPPLFLREYANGSYPPVSPGDVLRKRFWLNATVLARAADLARVQAAFMELNTGVMPGLVDEVKKSSDLATEADASEAEP